MQTNTLRFTSIAKCYENRKEDIFKWKAKAIPQSRWHLTLSLKNNYIKVKEQRERYKDMICESKKDEDGH